MTLLLLIDESHLHLDDSGLASLNDDLRSRVLAGEGEFLDPTTGQPLDLVDQNRVRARLRAAGAGERLRQHSEQAREAVWWSSREVLIPRLMDKDQHSLVIGQKGAGKSRVGMDVLETAVRPGHMLFDTFGPANLGAREKTLLINAETPAVLVEEEIERRAMHAPGLRPFEVLHLAEIGGARILDVTIQADFDALAEYLPTCMTCDGSDFEVPALVIVDGLTAILGESASRYGEWTGKWLELMAHVGVRNSIVIAHATYDGKHPLGDTTSWTGYSGVWFYTKSPGGIRTFRTEPRFVPDLEVKPIQIELGADGRLHSAANARKADSVIDDPDVERSKSAEQTLAERVLAFVAAETSAGRVVPHKVVLARVKGAEVKVVTTISELIAQGLLERVEKKVRGGRAYFYHLRPAGHASNDSKAAKSDVN